MSRFFKLMRGISAAALILGICGLGIQAGAQAEGKYAALCGDYEFEFEGQVMVVSFYEEDGVFYGAPEGETPEEIVPVEGEPLKFEVTVSTNGQYYEIEFVKGEDGKIDTCILRTMGMELEGYRIK
jgi:hypothetical protein